MMPGTLASETSVFGLPRVQAHLRALLAMGSPSRRHLRHSLLCTTLGGHDCDLLTITDFSDGDEGERHDPVIFYRQ